MSKKSKKKKRKSFYINDDYDATLDEEFDDEVDRSIPDMFNDGYLDVDEFLEHPAMSLVYDNYQDATKAQRKAERERRRRMYQLTDDKIEDIYDALGGKKQAKVYAETLRAYVDSVNDWLILKNTTTTVINRCVDLVYQGTEDLMKGVPWIFSRDNLMDYMERLSKM